MEYCPDGDFRKQISNHAAALNVDHLIVDFEQILLGLSALHSRVIHRDVKPENVLVAGTKLKIGDFGLSKFVEEATRTLTFKGSGSPRYMAPEAWALGRATAATDLYAVGIMLFEAMTGRPPFEASDINALRDLHLYQPAPRAKSLNPAIPDRLDGVVKKLLTKEPAGRYQSAQEVIDALRPAQISSLDAEIAGIANRLRQHHDSVEAQRLEDAKRRDAQQSELEKNIYKERELLELIEDVVAEINAHLEELKIQARKAAGDQAYAIGQRTLVVHFFPPGELYDNPEVPGRMDILRKHSAVHGGFIEIRENGEDREGWNLVLVRPEGGLYGEWLLVESETSPLSGSSTRYTPVATEARLFADNLARHWMRAMHVYQLKDKPLERADIIKIIEKFVPSSR